MSSLDDAVGGAHGGRAESVDGVFATLASENRRLIIELLVRSSGRGREAGMSISEVAMSLGTNRFTASRHLRTLYECGLVTATQRGTATIYSIRIEPLWSAEDWLFSLTNTE